MKQIDFSVFSYSPSIITKECINLGVLFHDAENNDCKFEYTNKWNRISSFDDELNIEFVKDYLKGIKKQVEPSLLVSPNNWVDFIKRFVNEFKFSNISSMEVEDKDKFIIDTKRIYLRYDFPENERPKPEEQKQFIKKYLRENSISYSLEPIIGKYNETIKYDYQVDSKCFKHFEFDNKNVAHMLTSIHAWRDIALEMQDVCETIFVYDTDALANPEFGIAVQMLKNSAASVYNYSEVLGLILKLNSRQPATSA